LVRDEGSPVRSATRGRLEAHVAEGTALLKEVTGTSCAEVASALALVLSLALDANANERPETTAPPAPAPTPPPAADSIAAPMSEAPAPERRWAGAFGVLGSLAFGYATAPSVGGTGFVEIDRTITTPWHVLARVSGIYLASGTIDESWGSADVSIAAG